MKRYFENLAKALFDQPFLSLNPAQQKVIESIAGKTHVSEDVNQVFSDRLSFGERLADRMATFGGSWKFIGLFFVFIVVWVVINTVWLWHGQAFDPYPYILLNLGLSSLAAFQAPIIMMSQNRQAAKDRIKQKSVYEINLKIELEIMRIHQRLDALCDGAATEAGGDL